MPSGADEQGAALMNDPHGELRSTRSSLTYSPAAAVTESRLRERLQRHHGAPGTLYGYTFVEDASSLLPWGHGPDDGFTATITPSTPELDDLVRNALAGFDGVPPSRLEDGIRHHLQQAAHQLLFGEAIYEIDYLTPSDVPGGQPVGFRIGLIYPPGSVQRVGVKRRYVQYVPAELGGSDTIKKLHYRELIEQNLVILCLPWGRRRSLRHALSVLAAAGSPMGTEQRLRSTPQSDFDPMRFKARMAQEILSATKDLGWHGKYTFDNQMLPPYQVWRHLRFQRFKIELRDVILEGLTTALQRATGRLGEQVKLHVAGLLTSADIDRAESDLKTGSRNLAELLALLA
jgi:hypothetical protein